VQDKDGWTPLFIAAKKGHAAIVEQLITARCNIDLPLKSVLYGDLDSDPSRTPHSTLNFS
jgi:ankyrin repeat protein